MRSRLSAVVLTLHLLAVLVSCASTPPRPTEPTSRLNDLSCQFVGLEAVDGGSDTNADSVVLIAAYRFAGPGVAAPKAPLSLKFQVDRSRTSALRSHLSARPDVICSPDENSNYTARVEPFDGSRGIPQRGGQ